MNKNIKIFCNIYRNNGKISRSYASLEPLKNFELLDQLKQLNQTQAQILLEYKTMRQQRDTEKEKEKKEKLETASAMITLGILGGTIFLYSRYA